MDAGVNQGSSAIQPERLPAGFGSGSQAEQPSLRLAPPRAPEISSALQAQRAEDAMRRRERGVLERRSMLRGLLLLAVFVLAVSLLRAGWERAFPAGWWNQ